MTEVIAVYQDCVLCGAKGKQIISDYSEKGIVIRKVSFISDEGRELCAKAVNLGIGSMPFYTDGRVFATTIDGVIDGANESIAAKKNKQLRKEKKNGTVSKNKR